MASSAVFVNSSKTRLSIDYNYLGFLALLIIPVLFFFGCYYRRKKNSTPTYVTGDEERPYVKRQATEVDESNMRKETSN